VRGNEILLTIITDKYKKKLILVSILMPKNTLRSLMEWGNENIGGVNEI